MDDRAISRGIPRRGHAPAVLALCGAVALAGCGAGAGPGHGITVDTLESGVVLVRNPDRGLAGDAPAVPITEQVRIGMMDGPEAYVFGSVRAASLGADGRIYVLDNQAKQLRIFHPDGRHLRTAGRAGSGPGEFGNPTGMAWAPDGTLWVVDPRNQRYSAFSADGELVGTYRRVVGGFGFFWEGGFDRDGHLYDPSYYWDAAAERSRRLYVRHRLRDGELAAVDSFAIPEFESPHYRVEWNGSVMGFGVPFAPGLTWRFDGHGGFWVGTGERYGLWHQTLDGDTTRIIELLRERVPVAAEERRQAEEWLRETVENRGGMRQIDLSRIPATWPAHGPFVMDDLGGLWVAHRPRQNWDYDRTEPIDFDVFDPEGRYIGAVTVDVALRPPPLIVRDRIIGVTRDEFGVERVVVYAIDTTPTDS